MDVVWLVWPTEDDRTSKAGRHAIFCVFVRDVLLGRDMYYVSEYAQEWTTMLESHEACIT